MDQLITQVIGGVVLLLLGGFCGFLLDRVTKQGDALAVTQSALAVALNDITHLKEKAGTHTHHIDTLFEMKTTMATMDARVEQISKTLPEALALMTQLATLLVKKAEGWRTQP